MKKKDLVVPNFKPFIPQASIRNAVKVLRSDWIGGDGPYVKEYEREIAKVIKNKNVVAVNSGTSALQLALHIIGVQGGEVITSPMTCIATNMGIASQGARIVWSDIDPTTGNIDPADIARKITKKTKAIMVVHWGGAPADLHSIQRIATKHKIPVIEDAAQALGSEYAGKPIGSHSDFVAFSTQAIKIINTVEGGILAIKRSTDAKRAKKLRWYGIDRDARIWDDRFRSWEYPISEIGYKMQLTDLNAAIGLGQIPYLKKHLKIRRAHAKIYRDALKTSNTLTAQRILPKSIPNYWTFTVICKDLAVKMRLAKVLKKIGVQAEVAHTRNDAYPVFLQYKKEVLPGVALFNDHHLIIPIGQWVTQQKAKQIAHVLASF